MQRKMINGISASMFMAPRTKSVISCHCSIYGAEPLPVSLNFSPAAILYKKVEAAFGDGGGMLVQDGFHNKIQERDARLHLTQNIPVLVQAGFKIQMCISSL